MRSATVFLLFLFAGVQPSFADRIPYGDRRNLTVQGVTLTVEHQHDWSKVPATEDGWTARYSESAPYGVDEEISNLKFYSSSGELIACVPSPPLTYLALSPDERYVIGLSQIKLANPAQLVVFDSKGQLLLKRRIAASSSCFGQTEFERLKSSYPETFASLAKYSRFLGATYYGWRDGERIFLDVEGIGANISPQLRDELDAARCDSPLSPNFSESVTNWIHWYQREDPQPRIVETGGGPIEVRLRDPAGVEFAVQFESTPLELD
jgi:hypothetical protein